jgi:hypothetical protein
MTVDDTGDELRCMREAIKGASWGGQDEQGGCLRAAVTSH